MIKDRVDMMIAMVTMETKVNKATEVNMATEVITKEIVVISVVATEEEGAAVVTMAIGAVIIDGRSILY